MKSLKVKKDSMHKQIHTRIRRVINEMNSRFAISPVIVADLVLKEIDPELETNPEILFGYIHYCRKRAQEILSAEHDEVEVENKTPEFPEFKGLQKNYHKADGTGFVQRDYMVDEDYSWNVKSLRKESDVKALHADALEVEQYAKRAAGIFDVTPIR